VSINAKVTWSHIALCNAKHSTAFDAVGDVAGNLQWQAALSPACFSVRQANDRQATKRLQ